MENFPKVVPAFFVSLSLFVFTRVFKGRACRISFFRNAGKNDPLNSEKWTKEEEGNRLQENTLVGVGARCSTWLRGTNVSEIRGNSPECNEICRHVSRIKMSSLLFPVPRRPVPPSSTYDVASPCVALRFVSFLGTSR